MILRLFVWFFKRKGWRIEGKSIDPAIKKCIVIGAPHTSNWDFVYAMAAIRLFGIKLNYLAKKELFRWPLKKLFTSTGGIPVERSKHTHMVDSIIKKFNDLDSLILAISPEGTRKKTEKIKTGFYHVALATGVPICLAYIDYKKRVAGFGEPFYPSGDRKADAAIIKDFYREKEGKFPELFNLDAIRLDE